MNYRTAFWFAMALTVLALPHELRAQEPRYRLVDLGTLGGPHSYGSVNGEGFSLLNNAGEVASFADSALPDPNSAFFCYDPDCFQGHAFRWKDGVLTDLGALDNTNSAAGSINAAGWATGQSESSVIDPVLGIPEFRAVLWKHNQIMDLGTLADGTQSLGIYVNNAGQVVGFSTISTAPDLLGFFGFPTHTFLWENGHKEDIGTLGGTDSLPGAICSNQQASLIVGGSTTTAIINTDTGLPTADPFLWRNGRMIDLGSLGGTNGFAQCANNRGQVIGLSSLAANPAACSFGGPGCHAFFWQGGMMSDLGTLGGPNSEAIWINDAGMIVGSADLPAPDIHDAVVWKEGKILDLGTVDGDPCSRGRGLNARGQVVGGSSDCHNFLHAFVWEEGGPMLDLNALIAPGSGWQLTNAFNINDRGEILAKAAAVGFTPNDDEDLGHLVLLVPCDGEEEDCAARATDIAASRTSSSGTKRAATGVLPRRSQGDNPATWRSRLQDYVSIAGPRKN